VLFRSHISAQGIEVVGPVNHGIIYSIYFYDPVNDIRLEITTPLDPDWNNRGEAAQAALETWAAAKQRAREKGTSVLEEIQIQHRATTALESDS
jgi:catechol-2,3-dioxygenase